MAEKKNPRTNEDGFDDLVPVVGKREYAAQEKAQEEANRDTVLFKELAARLGLQPHEFQAVIKTATAAQQAEIQALREELNATRGAHSGAALGGLLDENASVGGFPWMLWRKPDNWPDAGSRNWISIGPGGSTPTGKRDTGSYSRYLQKGMIPITKYGYIEPPASEHGERAFFPLFYKYGDTFAAEFPASQVIAYQWHKKPPMAGLRFAQYEAIKDQIKQFTCEACGMELFFMPDDEEAGSSYRTHLMKRHDYPFREAAEAVKQQGFTLTPYRKPSNPREGVPVSS